MLKHFSGLLGLSIATTLLVSSISAEAQLRVRNASELRQAYGLTEFRAQPAAMGGLKIAVLDNSFEGFIQNSDSLPASAELIRGPLRTAPGGSTSASGHGLMMAQIVWAMSGSLPEGPKFYLIEASGITNLRAAIEKSIELDVDVVLYASTWETGGNYDGRGFINAEVTRAAKAGILWINAAGNDHNLSYTGQIKVDAATGALRLPGAGNVLSFSNKLTNNPVKLTLSWTDYKETEEVQTTKDLDWELSDWTGRTVKLKNLRQGEQSTCGDSASYARGSRENSLHPREQDEVTLQEGVYQLRVYDCSGNFVPSDRVRLVLQSPKGDSLKLHEANGSHEINPPADNANVITVGDLSPVSSIGPTFDGRVKPDFRMPVSRVEMSDGLTVPMGSSVASAIFAGITLQLKSNELRFSRETLLRIQKKLSQEQNRSTEFGPTWRTPSPYELPALFW